MKLLTFVTSIDLSGGGPSRSVPILAKGLAEEGVDVTLLTQRTEQMNLHDLEDTDVKLKAYEKFSAKEIEEWMREEKFDIIQLQSVWDLPYHKVAEMARKQGIPYLLTPRGMLEPWSLEQKKWKKKLALWLYQMNDLKKAACIFTTADMEAEHVHQLGVNAPCSVIPNGIETSGYPCRTDETHIEKRVLFLSRIHEKKGIEILIEAFSKLREESLELREWSVMIVGNGEAEYIESLKQRVKSKGMEGCIQILPPVFGEAKKELYQNSALFCLPSYSENFGMVIAEAMSCGVPAITTTNCPWEILNETHTGWCIDLSVENLEKTLREAMGMDSSELFEKGQRSSKLVFENFNYRNVAKRTVELYRWILDGGKTPKFVKMK